MADGLLKKKPDAAFFRLTAESWNQASFEEYLAGQGLFNDKYIVFLDNILEETSIKDYILEKLPEISKSANIFIWLERKVAKPVADKIKKSAEKAQEFLETSESGRDFSVEGGLPAPSEARQAGKTFSLGEFNIFSLADAFGRRDKKNLWTLYQKAIMREIPAEEISGVLFWQLKSMILAEKSKNADEAGIKPFVYSKAKAFARNYKEDELKNISSELVSIYHDSHRGMGEFEMALERFILGI